MSALLCFEPRGGSGSGIGSGSGGALMNISRWPLRSKQ
jgi:hypothetical protein